MCKCNDIYKGEYGYEKIKDLAKKTKQLDGETYAIAKNKKEEYYYILYADALLQSIVIIEII